MAKHKWKMKGCPDTETGEWTPWCEWKDLGGLTWTKCQVDKGGWFHSLIAEHGESNKDSNHVHVKWRMEDSKNRSEWVLASVKINSVYVSNRGELLDRINNLIGTKFTVQDIGGE